MDISRIEFSETKYGATFDQLDVNKDGVINENDAISAQDSKVKATILKALNDVDDDAELSNSDSNVKAASTGKDKYGINKTDSKNFDQDVTNSKGTVYVIMGNIPGCGYCTRLAKEMQSRLDELENVCNVYNIQWNDNASLCSSIYNQAGNKGGASFPQIAKFVDGKFVGLVDNPRNPSAAVDAMIKGATGTPGKADEAGGADDTKAAANGASAKTAEDITKAAEDLKTKYPATGTGSGYSMNNPELAAFNKAMDDGFIAALEKEGFSQTDIVDIVAQAFPTIGIKNTGKGGYSCPNGTDADAKALYNKFIDQLKEVANPEVTQLRAQVAELNAQIVDNNSKLAKLKGTIEVIKNEVQKAIEEAIKDSEEIKEEQKKEAASIVKEEIDAYANSDGQKTYDEFKSGLKNRLDALEGDGTGKLAAVIGKLMRAENQMSVLDSTIKQFGTLVDANKKLSDEIGDLNKKAAEAEDCPDCKAERCDPIGFEMDGTTYDFFVDKDNNGDITNENEFLGADSGWAEMTALDTNNDGKLTADEMKDLKLVARDAEGNQTVKNATDIFDGEDSIDLSSYQNVNQDFENGNTLLGTFSLNVDGKEITDGYNTLDKVSWLDDTFEFTDETAGINRFAQGDTELFDITDLSKEYEQYQADFTQLNTQLDGAWNKVGITRSDVSANIITASKKQAESKAEDIAEKFKTKLKEENDAKAAEEENTTPEETTPEETTPPEDDATDPNKKLPEEE